MDDELSAEAEIVDENEIDNDAVDEERPRDHNVGRSASLMIANLRASSCFTGAALTRVAGSAANLLSGVTEFVNDEMKKFCNSEDMDINSPEVQILLDKFNFNDLFNGMDSLQGQIKALKEHYHFIKPVEIPLGCRLEQRFCSQNQCWRQTPVYETFQYIPIIETSKLITYISRCCTAVR